MIALKVGPVSIEIHAPASLVYEMMCAIGQGAQQPGGAATVLERDGGRLVCEFETTIRLPVRRPWIVRTREAVRIVPPDTIHFEHLDGPIRGLSETITVRPTGQRRALVSYEGRYPIDGLGGRLRWLIARPVIDRAVAEHFADIKRRAEERAARSRVFAA